MQPPEKIAIAGKVAAIEKRNRELSIVGVVAVAFGQGAGSRAQLEPQIPQLLREAAHWIFKALFGVAVAEEKEKIDVGIGEEPATAEAPGSNQREIDRLAFVGGNDVAPQAEEDTFDQAGALRHRRAPVPSSLKLPVDARRLVVERTPQFADQ